MVAAMNTLSVSSSNINLKQIKPYKHPNVLMILVDDWGSHDLSMSGSRLYETPNIDALSHVSTSFSQAYVAYPRSVPSRYSFMTGRHCARPQTGAKADDRKVDKDSYCIAQPFKKGGYSTFLIGKWHLSNGKVLPQDKGFDINIGGGRAGATSSYFAPFNRDADGIPDKMITGMDDAQPGEYLTDYMIRKTDSYLREKHEKPFFAICSFYAVHTPLQAKPEIIKKYEQKVQTLGLGTDPMRKEEAGVCKTQQDNAVYAAMIESVDQGVGQLIQTLKVTKQYDNTIIVIVSDHGGLSNRGTKVRELATTNYPLKGGKGHLYEGGIRVPLLIHLAGQQSGGVKSDCVISYDLLPTLTDLCNVPVSSQAELDGVSLRPLLTTNVQPNLAKRDLFWHKASERPNSTGDYLSSAVRSGDYKLIDFYTQGRIELYNIKMDPGENHNLKDSNPKIADELMAKLNTCRKNFQVKMGNNSDNDKKAKKKAKRMMRKNADVPSDISDSSLK